MFGPCFCRFQGRSLGQSLVDLEIISTCLNRKRKLSQGSCKIWVQIPEMLFSIFALNWSILSDWKRNRLICPVLLTFGMRLEKSANEGRGNERNAEQQSLEAFALGIVRSRKEWLDLEKQPPLDNDILCTGHFRSVTHRRKIDLTPWPNSALFCTCGFIYVGRRRRLDQYKTVAASYSLLGRGQPTVNVLWRNARRQGGWISRLRIRPVNKTVWH